MGDPLSRRAFFPDAMEGHRVIEDHHLISRDTTIPDPWVSEAVPYSDSPPYAASPYQAKQDNAQVSLRSLCDRHKQQ